MEKLKKEAEEILNLLKLAKTDECRSTNALTKVIFLCIFVPVAQFGRAPNL